MQSLLSRSSQSSDLKEYWVAQCYSISLLYKKIFWVAEYNWNSGVNLTKKIWPWLFKPSHEHSTFPIHSSRPNSTFPLLSLTSHCHIITGFPISGIALFSKLCIHLHRFYWSFLDSLGLKGTALHLILNSTRSLEYGISWCFGWQGLLAKVSLDPCRADGVRQRSYMWKYSRHVS